MRAPVSNADLLAWFGEHEREVCDSCGQKTCVRLPGALASFCLGCDAVTLDGERLDVDRHLPV